jgi:glycosyltransferase involved in cell wall biosynthesis
MKISGFTFVRDAEKRGYPIQASIRSLLPLVDEFVVALGPCTDSTEELIRAIGDPKIRIIPTVWNDRVRSDTGVRGFVYGQQKSIALFNCTGDWAFYLEADEVVHEDDLPIIRACMERHLDDPRVEAMVFDYLHFYGNGRTIAWSPAWYRQAARVLRNTIPAWGPKGLFFTVLDTPRRGRYPRAVRCDGARIFHYGWVRSEEQMQRKADAILGLFDKQPKNTLHVGQIDPQALRSYEGSHPAAMQDWLPPASGVFEADANYKLTYRDKRHRALMRLERLFGFTFNRAHYRLLRR